MSGKLTELLNEKPFDEGKLIRYGRLRKLDIDELVNFAVTYTGMVADNVVPEVTPLHIACIKSKVELIRILVSEGWPVNTDLEKLCSPLHIALDSGNIPAARLLLELGADFRSMNRSGCTPMAGALSTNKREKACVSAVKLLLNVGVSVNAIAEDKSKLKPIHIAVKNNLPTLVSFLLQMGANANAKDEDGNAPLHIAIYNNYAEVIKLLIRHGVDLYLENPVKDTPLKAAVKHCTHQTVEVLVRNGCDVKTDSVKGVTSALHMAIFLCKLDVVKLLVAHGADTNMSFKYGVTPLHEVATRRLKNLAEVEECPETRKDIAEFLVDEGGNINARDCKGNTPLKLAIDFGYLNLAKLFLQVGANLKMKGNETLFHQVVSLNRDIIVHFLDFGGDYSKYNSQGYTPYHLAISLMSDVKFIKSFVEHGCPYNQDLPVWKNVVEKCNSESIGNFFVAEKQFFKGIKENNLELVKSAVNDGAVATGCCEEYKYPLHFVAYNGYLELLTFLLEKNVPPNTLNEQGDTALHVAAKQGHFEVCCTLLRFGACYNYCSKKSPKKPEVVARGEVVQNLLHTVGRFFHMARLGRHRVIKELETKLGVNICEYLMFVNAINIRGETLLETALRHNHSGIARKMMNLRVGCDM